MIGSSFTAPPTTLQRRGEELPPENSTRNDIYLPQHRYCFGRDDRPQYGEGQSCEMEDTL